MTAYRAGIAIRGEWFEDNLVEFGGRGVGITFLSPEPKVYVGKIPLQSPMLLADLYGLSFEQILDYVEALGERLQLADNRFLQEALEASCLTAAQTRPPLTNAYESLPNIFNRHVAREMADSTVGIDHLEGWVKKKMIDGRDVSIRAFGARALHIIAGNHPGVAGLSILRNMLTRSDAIIKSPSNDPFTALAIARTMIELDAKHPLTRHLTVAYWKGGDEDFEKSLYQPRNIEKIIAWGGFASVKHVTKYIQPGLELVSLDPKRSISIVGPEGLADEATQREVALRLATDIGTNNQEGCVNARVVYVVSGTDAKGLENINRLGRYTYEALMGLPAGVSTKAKEMNNDLRSLVRATSLNDEWFKVFGGTQDEGAIIVSQMPEQVDFATRLANRVANLVPIDSIEEVYQGIDAYTQTVGVYPESLKLKVRDLFALHGAQRFTSLGYASFPTLAVPQDGIESMRQMCKWIVSEDCDPAVTAPLWEDAKMFRQVDAA